MRYVKDINKKWSFVFSINILKKFNKVYQKKNKKINICNKN